MKDDKDLDLSDKFSNKRIKFILFFWSCVSLYILLILYFITISNAAVD